MAKQKDFNAMLGNDKDMPKIQIIKDLKTIERYGGSRMLLAPPREYDAIMRLVPAGKVIMMPQIRAALAARHGADFTDPMTAGIFVTIAAWASDQREDDITPYWRTLKSGGELNEKYPGGVEAQREKLEAEGRKVVRRGKRLFVENPQDALADIK